MNVSQENYVRPREKAGIFHGPASRVRVPVVRGRKNPLSSGLADRLKQTRLERESSCRALSLAAGLSADQVNNIEKSISVPAIDTVELIAVALGVSACWLAYGSTGPEPFQQKRPRGAEAEIVEARDAQPYYFAAAYKRAGDRLKARRELLGLSLRQLAAAAGISVQTVANTEAGTTVPKVDNVERLAVALQCAPCWLAFGVGSSGQPH